MERFGYWYRTFGISYDIIEWLFDTHCQVAKIIIARYSIQLLRVRVNLRSPASGDSDLTSLQELWLF